MHKLKFALVLVLSGLASACGAPGTSGGGTITISSSNASQVSVASTGVLTTSLAYYTANSGYAPASKDVGSSTDKYSLLGQVQKIMSLYQSETAGKGVYSPLASVNLGCSSGTGTWSYDGTSASGNFSIAYNNCVLYGTTQNGSMTGTISTSGSTTTMSFSYNNFSVSGSNYSSSINGSITATITSSSITLSIGSLTATANYGGESYTTSITNYTATVIQGSGEVTMDVNGTYTDTQLGGGLTIETLETVHILTGASFPYQGKVRITSGGNIMTITYNSDGDSYTVQIGTNTYNCSYLSQTCS